MLEQVHHSKKLANDDFTDSIGMDLDGISISEIDKQCQSLFEDTPIRFVPKSNSEIDMKIKEFIDNYNVTLPIVRI